MEMDGMSGMTIPVVWLSRHPSIDAHGPWDTRILDDLFAGAFGDVGTEFVHIETSHIDPGGAAIVVLPARHHVTVDDIGWLNAELAKRDAVLLILCGDEEAGFPWKTVDHPRLYWWVQMPTPALYSDLQGAFWFGNGAPHGSDPNPTGSRDGFFFAGQVTHSRRKEAVAGLKLAQTRGVSGVLSASEGFAQGLSVTDYLAGLGAAMFAPCPSGPKHQDTFRAYEALEAAAVTLVDARTPKGDSGYWQFAYGPNPLIEVDDWHTVGGLIEQVADPAATAAYQSAWWTRQKRGMASRLAADLTRMGVELAAPSRPTILVTTSPSPSNPDLSMIVETVESAHTWWPEAEVVVACDGVRPEQEHMREQYSRFLQDLAGEANFHGWTVYVAAGWRHQASLIRETLDAVATSDVLLVMEHDTPLVTGMPAAPDHCFQMVAAGTVEVLRFHHEASILPVHEHLMVDPTVVELGGVPVRRTKQWSQRPHLARRDYYERILRKHFSEDARCFVEDRMYGIVLHAPRGRHRIAIYHPPGDIKRSYHLDGRQGGPKFDDIQVW